MKICVKRMTFVLTLLLAACAQEAPTPTTNVAGKPAYITLNEDLSQLKADFNAMTDKVRLVFISGPSCGICLRGMDDLNEAIVASLQNDPRIHTFVLYVPTLGAKEKHVAAAVPLMQGPRINHARTDHFLETGADTVGVSCPFCLQMMTIVSRP